jgi:hypothetical protein
MGACFRPKVWGRSRPETCSFREASCVVRYPRRVLILCRAQGSLILRHARLGQPCREFALRDTDTLRRNLPGPRRCCDALRHPDK